MPFTSSSVHCLRVTTSLCLRKVYANAERHKNIKTLILLFIDLREKQIWLPQPKLETFRSNSLLLSFKGPVDRLFHIIGSNTKILSMVLWSALSKLYCIGTDAREWIFFLTPTLAKNGKAFFFRPQCELVLMNLSKSILNIIEIFTIDIRVSTRVIKRLKESGILPIASYVLLTLSLVTHKKTLQKNPPLGC